jgi:branched-chain amino acid transport system ATP-binding protein
MAGKILELKNFHYYYGEIKAVKGINIEVKEKEIVTLIGSNGAGKTTTLNAASGLLGNITEGEVWFMGEKINGKPPHKIRDLGLALCLEGRHIFSQLTVKENLMMGAYLRKRKDHKAVQDDLEYVFNLFPRLKEREKQLGGTLSGGEQQMLAVGRALMQRPKLLMMDEPSLGLAPLVIRDIFTTIRKINEDGIPVLLIEQNSKAALSVAHRGYVMETGNIMVEDTAENLANNEEVQRIYLGIE